jgi:hypothetical protein
MAVHDYFPFLKRPPAKYVTPEGAEVFGVLAIYNTPYDVYHAAEKVRDAGYARWDVHAPFPIHGIESAMGMRRTRLPLIVGLMAFTGTALAYLMQYWMSGDYPLLVQGKPPDAWQPYVPIMFEISILLAAFTAIFAMLGVNGLPKFYHPLLKKESFLRITQDAFAISIEANDPNFDPLKTKELLESTGARSIELVEE